MEKNIKRIYMFNCIILLFGRDKQNIVSQWYVNKIKNTIDLTAKWWETMWIYETQWDIIHENKKKKTHVYKSKNYSHKEEFLDAEICTDCVLVMLLN